MQFVKKKYSKKNAPKFINEHFLVLCFEIATIAKLFLLSNRNQKMSTFIYSPIFEFCSRDDVPFLLNIPIPVRCIFRNIQATNVEIEHMSFLPGNKMNDRLG